MSYSQQGLIGIALLIPIAGFILTLTHARKGETRVEQRWRKRHGLLFWVVAPAVSGAVTVVSAVGSLPSIFTVAGVALLGGTTFLSWTMHARHDER